MRMKMPLRVVISVAGRLVESHGVGKWNVEHAVVGGNDLFQNRAQLPHFLAAQFGKAPEVAAAA